MSNSWIICILLLVATSCKEYQNEQNDSSYCITVLPKDKNTHTIKRIVTGKTIFNESCGNGGTFFLKIEEYDSKSNLTSIQGVSEFGCHYKIVHTYNRFNQVIETSTYSFDYDFRESPFPCDSVFSFQETEASLFSKVTYHYNRSNLLEKKLYYTKNPYIYPSPCTKEKYRVETDKLDNSKNELLRLYEITEYAYLNECDRTSLTFQIDSMQSDRFNLYEYSLYRTDSVGHLYQINFSTNSTLDTLVSHTFEFDVGGKSVQEIGNYKSSSLPKLPTIVDTQGKITQKKTVTLIEFEFSILTQDSEVF
ncbi:hypothetical protein QNI16_08995 [Cytophagaceae bacterium YF14B1]|uniref:Uncharacterized protein n=1 Tax=Xanthocytophaga flava TaxID=3048013 RepID=A0AAE3U8F0_9BACT|nr:hypothetical protein [Xanthocytophaga flavus]MDJ1480619.1 hypothetical protein [Xanthocytophaga flavus]